MKKDIFINIEGTQGDINDGDPITVMLSGQYYEKNGSQYIMYTQYDEESEKPCKNRIKIKDDTVELKKEGTTNVRMFFEENKNNTTYYDMEEGSMIVETKTDRVKIRQEEDHLKVELFYQLYMNYSFLSDCHIVIEARSKKEKITEEMES